MDRIMKKNDESEIVIPRNHTNHKWVINYHIKIKIEKLFDIPFSNTQPGLKWTIFKGKCNKGNSPS